MTKATWLSKYGMRESPFLDHVVVGAVGASGGTVDQDIKVAEAAVAALKLA